MKTMMTTTALVLSLAAGGAVAESHSNTEEMQNNLENAGDSLAEATENAADATAKAVDTAAGKVTASMQEDDDADDMAEAGARLIRVRDILGGEIYSVDTKNGDAEFSTRSYTEMGENWENIGEIEDIVLASNGELRGIVAEVGGFLNIGDKHVFVAIDNVKLVPVQDRNYKVVVGYSEDQLMQLKDVDEGFWN